MDLAEGEVRVFEVVGIAGDRRVPHVCEFACITRRALVQQLWGNKTIEDKISVEDLETREQTISGEKFDHCDR